MAPATSARPRTRRRQRCWPIPPRRLRPPTWLPRLPAGRSTSPGLARPTTSRLPATTSTGGRARALPRRSATGSPSPPGRATADSGLAIGSYYYKVRQRTGPATSPGASNEVTASVADSSPPTAPSGVATAVVGTTVNLCWSASSDNVGVARYNLYRGTSPGFTPSVANRIAQPLTTLYSDTRACRRAATTTS